MSISSVRSDQLETSSDTPMAAALRLVALLGSRSGPTLGALFFVVSLPPFLLLGLVACIVFFTQARGPSGRLLTWGGISLATVLVGVLVMVTVAKVANSVVARRDRGRPTNAEAETLDALMKFETGSYITPLAAHWLEPGAKLVLTDFLTTFENSLRALNQRLVTRVGPEIGPALPLHQQIGFAEELGFWSSTDVIEWRRCLELRHQILTGGKTFPHAQLIDRAAWLQSLCGRDSAPTSAGS